MNKQKGILFLSLSVLIVIGVVAYQLMTQKTTFGHIMQDNISDTGDITHLIIQTGNSYGNETLWARIDDPITIENVISEMSEISLQRQLRRSDGILENTMTVHTLTTSYYYDFDDDYFVGGGNGYDILSGSIVAILENEDLDFVPGEEFLNEE